MDRYFFRFVTMQACDGRTDRQTERINIARPRLHSYNVDIIIMNLNKKKYGHMFLPFCHNASV